MRVDIVTIFPDMVKNAAASSIVGRAQTAGLLDLRVRDLRDYAHNKHRATDDTPFGGGAGMVMTPAPLFECIEAITDGADDAAVPVILMAPDGEPFNQKMARELSALPRFVLLCGHYEGMDERVREKLVTREISVGDYVLTGGELPALTILDATTRLLPGVLGNADSTREESFSGRGNSENGEEILLEYPHYTRPADFRGIIVPGVLLSGHHANIEKWRRQQALVRTRARRPDLWEKSLPLSRADQQLVDEVDAGAEPITPPQPLPETERG